MTQIKIENTDGTYSRETDKYISDLTRKRVNKGTKLTYFEVKNVVGAHCFAAVLEELLDVNGDGQAL